jgi:hypothetical protein
MRKEEKNRLEFLVSESVRENVLKIPLAMIKQRFDICL